MLGFSRYTALVFAIGLGIGEAAMNWGHWQWWPLWVVDYIIVVALLAGFWRTRAGGNALELAAAWAFACGVFYMALFVSLNLAREGVERQSGNSTVLILMGIMLALTVSGLASAFLAGRRAA